MTIVLSKIQVREIKIRVEFVAGRLACLLFLIVWTRHYIASLFRFTVSTNRTIRRDADQNHHWLIWTRNENRETIVKSTDRRLPSNFFPTFVLLIFRIRARTNYSATRALDCTKSYFVEGLRKLFVSRKNRSEKTTLATSDYPRMRRRPVHHWILYASRSRDPYYGKASVCACASKCLHVHRRSPTARYLKHVLRCSRQHRQYSQFYNF